MYPPGHLGISLFLFAPLAFALIVSGRERAVAPVLAVALAVTLLPDADALVPGLAHRGLTHSLVAAAFLGTAVGIAGWTTTRRSFREGIERTALGALVGAGGVLSHLAGDVLTPMGVRPLFPLWPGSHSLRVVQASDVGANVALLLLGFAAVLQTVAYARACAVTPDSRPETDLVGGSSASAEEPTPVPFRRLAKLLRRPE